MYSHETIEAFSDALAALYSAQSSTEAIHGILPALERAFSSRYVAVDELPDVGVPVLHACTHAEEIATALNRYPTHAHELPSVKFVRAGGFAPAYRLLDFASVRELGRTTIYHELMRPAGLHDQIGLAVRLKNSGLGITINRDRAFSTAELALASLLRPHLAAVLAGVRRSERPLSRTIASTEHRIEVSPEGKCVGPLPSSVAALLVKYFANPRSHSSARSALPEELVRWIRVQARRLGTLTLNSAPGSAYQVHGPSGRLDVILCLSKTPSRLSLQLAQECTTSDWFRLRSRGLTSRECEVVYWVAQGKRDAEIATILGNATKTISKHLERILRKLGAENRAGAAHLATAWLNDRETSF